MTVIIDYAPTSSPVFPSLPPFSPPPSPALLCALSLSSQPFFLAVVVVLVVSRSFSFFFIPCRFPLFPLSFSLLVLLALLYISLFRAPRDRGKRERIIEHN